MNNVFCSEHAPFHLRMSIILWYRSARARASAGTPRAGDKQVSSGSPAARSYRRVFRRHHRARAPGRGRYESAGGCACPRR